VRNFDKVLSSVSLIVKAVRYFRGDVVLMRWQATFPDDVRCQWRDHGVDDIAVGEIWFAFQIDGDTLCGVSVWRFVRTLPSRGVPALEVGMQEHPVLIAAEHLIDACIHKRDDAGELCAVLLPRVPPFVRP